MGRSGGGGGGGEEGLSLRWKAVGRRRGGGHEFLCAHHQEPPSHPARKPRCHTVPRNVADCVNPCPRPSPLTHAGARAPGGHLPERGGAGPPGVERAVLLPAPAAALGVRGEGVTRGMGQGAQGTRPAPGCDPRGTRGVAAVMCGASTSAGLDLDYC